jgi:hypothetical protein
LPCASADPAIASAKQANANRTPSNIVIALKLSVTTSRPRVAYQ